MVSLSGHTLQWAQDIKAVVAPPISYQNAIGNPTWKGTFIPISSHGLYVLKASHPDHLLWVS